MSQLSFIKEKLKDLLVEHYPRLKSVREKLVDNKLNPFSYLIETTRESGNNYHHSEAGFFVDLGKNQAENETIALLVPVSQNAKQQKINTIIPLIITSGIFEFLQVFANKFTKNVRFIFHNPDLLTSGKLLIENNALQNVTQLYILNSNGMIPSNSIAINRKIVIPASEKFQIKIYNDEAAESVEQNTSTDIILVAAHAIVTLSQLSGRKLDPLRPAKLFWTSIHSSDKEKDRSAVTVDGFMLISDDTIKEPKREAIEKSLQAMSGAFGVHTECKKIVESPAVANHPDCIEILENAGEEMLGRNRVLPFDYVSADLLHLAEYFNTVPSAVLHVGCVAATEGASSSKTTQIDTIVQTGMSVMSWLIIKKS